jgi:hypothetical protein
MSHIYTSHFSKSSRKPAFTLVVALLVVCAFHHVTVYAEDAAAFRARIIQEVLLEVPDLEMAKQIAEIRINREFLKQQSPTAKPAPKDESAPKTPVERRLPIKQPVQGTTEQPATATTKTSPKVSDPINAEVNLQSSKRANNVYVGVGNRVVVGYAYPISTEFSLRADLAGLPTREGNKSIDGNQFALTENKTSLGAYLDWFPNGGDFRFSVGVNANRMQTQLQSVQGTSANINGKTFNTGTEVLDITYKFPLYTPYFGLGYQSTASENGWSVYADLGLMFGKYDAHARTSMVGLNTVTLADVDAELNTLRGSLFKWSYVPVGAVGIKYRY